MTGILIMPKNYIVVEDDEMEYLDGGLTMTNRQVRDIVTTITVSGAQTLSAIVSGVKGFAWLLAIKFSAIPLIGKIVGVALASWITSNAATIGERFFTAAVLNKGIKWSVGTKWVVIPTISGTLI